MFVYWFRYRAMDKKIDDENDIVKKKVIRFRTCTRKTFLNQNHQQSMQLNNNQQQHLSSSYTTDSVSTSAVLSDTSKESSDQSQLSEIDRLVPRLHESSKQDNEEEGTEAGKRRGMKKLLKDMYLKVAHLDKARGFMVVDKMFDFRLEGEFDQTLEKLVRNYLTTAATSEIADVATANSDSSESKRNPSDLQEIENIKNDESEKNYFQFCHRLDYATSGLIAVALRPDARTVFGYAFENRFTKKIYHSLLSGDVPLPFTANADEMMMKGSFGNMQIKSVLVDYSRVECPLLMKYLPSNTKSITHINAYQVDGCLAEIPNDFRMTLGNILCEEGKPKHSSCNGRPSRTYVIPLVKGSLMLDGHGTKQIPVTECLLIPVSGRRHQLRIHTLHMGYPIVGDATYIPILMKEKKDEKMGIYMDEPERMYLHSYQLKILMKDLAKEKSLLKTLRKKRARDIQDGVNGGETMPLEGYFEDDIAIHSDSDFISKIISNGGMNVLQYKESI